MKYMCPYNKQYFIYTITNIQDGKIYVGRTGNPEARHKRYCYIVNNIDKDFQFRLRKIHRSLKSDGLDNFVFVVIDTCKSLADAKRQEDEYITLYKSSNPNFGYNERGGQVDGNISLEEFKKRLSIRMSGNKNPMYGKPRSSKVKKIMSDKMRGDKNPFYGKIHSEETKKLIGKQSSIRNSGDGNPNAKLSINDVVEIREKYESGDCIYLYELAKIYNVTSATISNIVRYKTWKNV